MRILEATSVEQVEAAAPLYDGPPLLVATAAAHATYRAASGHIPELCDVITWTFGQPDVQA